MLPADVPRDAVIVTRNLQRDYDMGGEIVHALRGVDLDIRKNEFVAIMGPSGSGKSTLMNLIGCLDSPTAGEYWLNGHRVSELGDDELARIRNKEIGFVFQTFNLLPRATALHNVELPLVYAGHRRPGAARHGHRRARPGSGWRPDGTTGPTSCPAASGSAWPSRARWSTSRASCWPTSPPATSTAPRARRSWPCSRALHRDGQTIVLVTHEPDIAAHARRQVHLKDGRVERDFASREAGMMTGGELRDSLRLPFGSALVLPSRRCKKETPQVVYQARAGRAAGHHRVAPRPPARSSRTPRSR